MINNFQYWKCTKEIINIHIHILLFYLYSKRKTYRRMKSICKSLNIHALGLIRLSMIEWAGASAIWVFGDLSKDNYSRQRGQTEEQISYCSKLMIFIHCARKSNICFNHHNVTINSCFRFWPWLHLKVTLVKKNAVIPSYSEQRYHL